MADNLGVEDQRYDTAVQLLQYILRSRGIIGESTLILALMRLAGSNSRRDAEEWYTMLSGIIKTINLKLHPLNYKVLRVTHGVGKNVVARKSEDFSRFCVAYTGNTDIGLPHNNKFYVYIDTGSVEETKLATRFSTKEVEFIKWALQEISDAGSVVRNTGCEDSTIAQEVNGIRCGMVEDVEDWHTHVSFTVGSSRLSQFKELTALEVEQLIIKLCENKWFARNKQGAMGLDIRCIAELEENLITGYGFLRCDNCDRLAVQGVLCDHEGREIPSSIWHVDCYQHQISHVSQDCKTCGKSLITSGVYVI